MWGKVEFSVGLWVCSEDYWRRRGGAALGYFPPWGMPAASAAPARQILYRGGERSPGPGPGPGPPAPAEPRGGLWAGGCGGLAAASGAVSRTWPGRSGPAG